MDKSIKGPGSPSLPGREKSLPDLIQQGETLNFLPVAAYTCDMEGYITAYNDEAARLWARQPVIGPKGERYSGAYKLYKANGEYLPHNKTPAAACLQDGLPRKDAEIIVQRPDHSCIHVKVNVTPIRDEKGVQVGMVNCLFDITAQKIAENQLHRTSMELRDYVNNGNVGLHWVNADGIIKWANKAELEMLGYTAEEYIGRHIAEFHANQETIADILRRLGNNEALDQYESQLICRNGDIKTVHISSSVFRENNKFVHTRCFTIDVTERKKLNQALIESEARYRQLIQTLEAPLYMTDREGRITLFNKAAADLWGQEPEIGKDLWCGPAKMLNTDGSDLPLDNCPMAICLKEQRPIYDEEILVLRRDGSLRHVAPHCQPILDSSGKMTGTINMLLDITNLKNKEKALRESEDKYRLLASSLERKVAEKMEELKKSEDKYHRMIEDVEDYVIILLDKDGVIQNWNKGAEKIKGYKEEDIVGKSFQEFYLPEDRKAGLPLQLLREAREKGKAVHEGWRKRADGSKFWASVVLTAIHDEQQNILGFSKVTRDLTERKLAEDRMKEYLDQLQFQNQELEQFVYAASHDLKEPLRKIHMYNSFIEEDPANVLGEKSKEYLQRSINAGVRMKGLIEDLLAYSRATARVEGYEEVDLNKSIEEIVSFHKEEFEQKKVRVEVGALAVIKAVPFQIKQLFSNLIDNAVKYRHPDRDPVVKISCELVIGSDIPVYKVDAGKRYYKIMVIDNGIGFDPRYAGKMFEIFQRLDPAAGVKGSGIGLSICKKIIQNHNGFIRAEGTPGEGAGFFVYFPEVDS